MFIGREAELSFLNEEYSKKGGRLVVLYGRKRVGKTETLKEFCKDKKHIFYSCASVNGKLQLSKFLKCVLKEQHSSESQTELGKLYGNDSEFEESNENGVLSWKKAFSALGDLPFGRDKKLVIIDEFSNMCKGSENVLFSLKKAWESGLKNENVMIVLCENSAFYIENELLSEKNPLCKIITGAFKTSPLSFYDAAKLLPNYTNEEKVFLYSVFGGIPHYLNLIDPKLSVYENIKRCILKKGSPLYNEVDFILRQGLRETSVYNTIMETIASGSERLSDISRKAYIDDTAKTSVYMKNLSELGLVERVLPVNTKSKYSISGGIYRITDNFFKFWFTFVFPNLTEIEKGNAEGVFKNNIEPYMDEYVASSFCDLCEEYIKKLNEKEELPFVCSKIGMWRGRPTKEEKSAYGSGETKIDILCVDKSESKYMICSCSFDKNGYDYENYLRVRALLSDLKDDAKFYYALFSRSSFDRKLRDEARLDDALTLFDLNDVVNLKNASTIGSRRTSQMESFLL